MARTSSRTEPEILALRFLAPYCREEIGFRVYNRTRPAAKVRNFYDMST